MLRNGNLVALVQNKSLGYKFIDNLNNLLLSIGNLESYLPQKQQTA